ncbi:MAG: hypothetical protein RSE34_03745 [Brevundimonas sp.]
MTDKQKAPAAVQAASLIRSAIDGILKAPPGVITDTIWTADAAPMTVIDALLLAQEALSPEDKALETRRHPIPDRMALGEGFDEAMAWIVKNAMAIRRDNGDMDYSLGAMIAAYEAGKSAPRQPLPSIDAIKAAILEGDGRAHELNANIGPQFIKADPLRYAAASVLSLLEAKP